MNLSNAKTKHSSSWRLLYAFIVVWLAAFIFLTPLTRRDPIKFQSTAQIKYASSSQQQLSPEELLSLLRSVVGQITQPNILGQIREQISEQSSELAKSGVALGTDDVNDIRRRLSISQDNGEKGLRLAISFVGKGGPDEQAFVNQLANRLALEIPRHSDHMAIAHLLKTNTGGLDMSKQVNLAEQIRAEVAQLNESIANLKLQASSSADSKSATEQVQDLEKQKADLRQYQGLDDSHPQMMQIQAQLEVLRAAILNDPGFRPVQIGVQAPADPIDTIKNRFYQASAKSSPDSTSSIQISERLADIDLSRIGTAATQLKAHAESVLDLKLGIDSALASRYQTEIPSFANLAAVSYSTTPALLPSAGLTPIWLLVVPCLIGALVAMYYNPLSDRMQLKSAGDVTRSMKLNIVGELPAGHTTSPPPRSERWSAISVRAAEYSLIAFGCVLFAACTMKPQVLSAALTNPLLALSNWFWLIVG